jgi:hypothetical protein
MVTASWIAMWAGALVGVAGLLLYIAGLTRMRETVAADRSRLSSLEGTPRRLVCCTAGRAALIAGALLLLAALVLRLTGY